MLWKIVVHWLMIPNALTKCKQIESRIIKNYLVRVVKESRTVCTTPQFLMKNPTERQYHNKLIMITKPYKSAFLSLQHEYRMKKKV